MRVSISKVSPGGANAIGNSRHIYIPVIAACVVFVLCSHAVAADKVVSFQGDGGKTLCRFQVELAITPAEQAKGLMHRKSLKEDAGMLFIHTREETQHYWMKNTFIPLDLVFINSRLEVASIFHYAKPHDETSMSSEVPVKYVLEINAGKVDRCKIKVGTKVRLKNISP
jgi:uncharacterized protein